MLVSPFKPLNIVHSFQFAIKFQARNEHCVDFKKIAPPSPKKKVAKAVALISGEIVFILACRLRKKKEHYHYTTLLLLQLYQL